MMVSGSTVFGSAPAIAGPRTMSNNAVIAPTPRRMVPLLLCVAPSNCHQYRERHMAPDWSESVFRGGIPGRRTPPSADVMMNDSVRNSLNRHEHTDEPAQLSTCPETPA